MESEAHRDQQIRPAWREGPDPVDYADPPDLLPSRTIDELLGPQADYRRTRGVFVRIETTDPAECPVPDMTRWFVHNHTGRKLQVSLPLIAQDGCYRLAIREVPRLRWWQRLWRTLRGVTDAPA